MKLAMETWLLWWSSNKNATARWDGWKNHIAMMSTKTTFKVTFPTPLSSGDTPPTL